MTRPATGARAWWKALHRARRVMLREHRKAFQDFVLFGSCAVSIPSDGTDPHHVPMERLVEMADQIVNPPHIYDPRMPSV